MFSSVAATENNNNYRELTSRLDDIYNNGGDLRSPFARDYTRILHSGAFRRLKHKTQVFYNIDNDHICTRMEHVTHVESVSYTIAKNLGLNEELTRAIAIGHDVGHSPFGHQGEQVLDELSQKYLGERFWHEHNSLHFIDDIELLSNPYNVYHNLNLTYAVRDGIISHCGEVDENHLFPRKEMIDLSDYNKKGAYMPVTWEGCVVKVSDKIAYLGRDIEDAILLGFIDDDAMDKLIKMAQANDEKVINTTVIISNMVSDLCRNSSPDKGICFSESFLDQINEIKGFNYKYIYANPRFNAYLKYSKLVITEIFEVLKSTYDEGLNWKKFDEMMRFYPKLMKSFKEWLTIYVDLDYLPNELRDEIAKKYNNKKPYKNPNQFEVYIRSIIDFIAGMTDRYAVKMFNEMLEY